MEKIYNQKYLDKSVYLNYIKTLKGYSLLSDEDEKKYIKDLSLLNNISIININKSNKINVRELNLSKLFLSCTDDNYKFVIDSLLSYYRDKTNKNDKEVYDKLHKYKKMGKIANRALNIDEINKIIKVNYDTDILESKQLLKEVENYLIYCQAYNKLFCSNLRLVAYFAHRYSKNENIIMDLISEGNIGLMRAIDEFDLSFETKFSTYASIWIMHYIRRYYIDNETTIRLPYNMKLNFMKYDKTLGNQQKDLSREEIKKTLNISEAEMQRYERYNFEFLSINKNVFDDDSETYEEFLGSDYNLEDEIMQEFLKGDIVNLLECLNDQEKKVITLRYGINNSNRGSGLTLSEVGSIMHLTGERIRIIEVKALRKMRFLVTKKVKYKELINYIRS